MGGMMSKNMKRDEKGHVILDGAKTFGTVISSKISKRSRATRLKDEADTRLLLLMRKGPSIDRFARKQEPVCDKQKDQIEFQNKLASQSPTVQFAYHKSKMDSLRLELKKLESCGNSRKYKFKEPIIRREMEEVKKQMIELGEIIMNQKKVISKEYHD
jgi:hypothetical protein